jgi:hypothetical protein
LFRSIARELAPSGSDGTHRAFATLTLAICLGSIPRLVIAQVPVRSISTLEELRRELAPKDGALLGWALDNGHSKPWIRIELPPVGLAVRSQLTF